MLITEPPRRDRHLDAADELPIVKLPSREARTATILVLPATPLPPIPLPSTAAMSPATKVPWPTLSATSQPLETTS